MSFDSISNTIDSNEMRGIMAGSGYPGQAPTILPEVIVTSGGGGGYTSTTNSTNAGLLSYYTQAAAATNWNPNGSANLGVANGSGGNYATLSQPNIPLQDWSLLHKGQQGASDFLTALGLGADIQSAVFTTVKTFVKDCPNLLESLGTKFGVAGLLAGSTNVLQDVGTSNWSDADTKTVLMDSLIIATMCMGGIPEFAVGMYSLGDEIYEIAFGNH